MDASLLATKTRIPPQTHGLAPRGRLVESLEQGIPGYKLVLISAAAGSGKTTLLGQWARASRVQVAWLTLDAEDNDPERFFRYLLRAWEAVQPGIAASPLGLLLGTSEPDREAVLTAFINAANDVPEHTVFVLDDVHVIEDQAIHAALTFLLDHLPPTLHVVLAGRAEPPLPLARYRARHELLELRTKDLHFSVDETDVFLNGLMGIGLTRDEIVPLHAQLEGWAAGLRLASLTLRQDRDAVDRLVISGQHRFIADYLSQDVLPHLPEDSERFLLQTSILDRLCGSLGDAVTGREDSQEMLERLERDNLFLAPLDDHREWFRYHRLFADFLLAELHRRCPDETAELHRRAAEWYLAQDMPEPAFRHAVAGDDLHLVVRVCERYVFVMLHEGELRLLEAWLDSLPAEWYSADPVFGLARASLLFFSGAFEAGVRCLDDVEQRLAPVDNDDTRRQLAGVTAIRCFVACMQNDLPRAETLADQALKNLPETDLSFRPGIYGALGDTYRRNGRWEEAKACYLKVLDFTHAPTFRVESVNLFGALADLELRQGRLRNAAGHWREALAAIQEPKNWGHLPLPVIGWVHTRLGELLYEWNELTDARDHLARGLERAELGGDVRSLIAGYLMASRMKLTEGDVEAAVDDLEHVRPLLEQASFPEWTSRFERVQLEIWLAQGRLRAAVKWVEAMLEDDALAARPEREIAHLAMARVLIAKGDAPSRGRALALLGTLRQTAAAEGRMGVQIEALALQALAQWQGGERAGAMTALEHALRLADPESYVRLFADLGLPMARLLQEARSRAVMPDYVARLLAAFSADLTDAAGTTALPEPLSGREREILSLIAAGLTNREIAGELAISPETVKKHSGSIYGKLGVGNRTEAAARARELDVLG